MESLARMMALLMAVATSLLHFKQQYYRSVGVFAVDVVLAICSEKMDT
jgi:hypothetical protein